jgi:hypothetical protein
VNLRWSVPSSGKQFSNGQADSIVGRNVLNCCLRYHVKIDEIMTLAFRHHNIDKFITPSDDSTAIANWLTELLLCRDGMLHLSGSDFDADRMTPAPLAARCGRRCSPHGSRRLSFDDMHRHASQRFPRIIFYCT